MTDGRPWPRLSVVTACRNSASHLEEALRSVLLQGYPDFEYFVVDGASTDGTLEILRTYEPWLSAWTSGPDAGQAAAIRLGFARSSGTLVAWLNADDAYLPGALARAATAHAERPEALIVAPVVHLDERSGRREVHGPRGLTPGNLVRYWEGRACWQQPGAFFPREAYERTGGLDARLHYAMDYDLLCRLLLQGTPVHDVEVPLATFRLHAESKTRSQEAAMVRETSTVSRRYWDKVGGVARADHDRFVSRALLGSARRLLARGRGVGAAALVLEALRVDPSALFKGTVRTGADPPPARR
jgi:GT2 family glycosyltransferase